MIIINIIFTSIIFIIITLLQTYKICHDPKLISKLYLLEYLLIICALYEFYLTQWNFVCTYYRFATSKIMWDRVPLLALSKRKPHHSFINYRGHVPFLRGISQDGRLP